MPYSTRTLIREALHSLKLVAETNKITFKYVTSRERKGELGCRFFVDFSETDYNFDTKFYAFIQLFKQRLRAKQNFIDFDKILLQLREDR